MSFGGGREGVRKKVAVGWGRLVNDCSLNEGVGVYCLWEVDVNYSVHSRRCYDRSSSIVMDARWVLRRKWCCFCEGLLSFHDVVGGVFGF